MSGREHKGAEPTRREAIKRGLALVGVAGAAASGRLLLDGAPAGAAESGSDDKGSTTTTVPAGGGDDAVGTPAAARSFAGQNFDVSGPAVARGALPERGDSLVISGDLLDSTGAVVGGLVGSYLQLLPFGQAGPGDVTSVEEHTFTLADGTIHGRGVTVADLEVANPFAIVGGTGRYAGLRGSYTAIQRFLSLGGDGTAQFVLTTNAEGSNHGGS